MSRPSFNQIPMLWTRDGSLRDVYFTGFGADGWCKFIQFASMYRLTYKVDGEDAEFPGVDEVFRLRDTSHCLSIWIGDAVANCHFFLEDEIELDLDPREVISHQQHDALLGFIERAALAVGVNASVTPEGTENSPFMTFNIETKSWKIYG